MQPLVKLKQRYKEQQIDLIFWAILAGFGSYFCMYAFRKPFATGQFANLELWGLQYKTILIIFQVIGYMLSKFIGIKVVASLKHQTRVLFVIGLILFAQLALVAFGLVGYPYNCVFLFLNGLPLGMVWGVVFSFLEGRKITEFITLGLSLNLIIGSGVLKTIYLFIKELTGISEFWMPAGMGFLFLPFFLFFVWMLSRIPQPSLDDQQFKHARTPLSKTQRKNLLLTFGPGIVMIMLLYGGLTTLRDFRDNFFVEIVHELAIPFNKTTFANTELTISFAVLIFLFSVGFFKNNRQSFNYLQILILFGLLICGTTTWLFQQGLLDGLSWLILLGFSFFLPYLLIQTLYFEKLIAIFKIEGNSGFFVYICDSFGYLGSSCFLIYREIFQPNLSWLELTIMLSYLITFLGLVNLIGAYIFFNTNLLKTQKTRIQTV